MKRDKTKKLTLNRQSVKNLSLVVGGGKLGSINTATCVACCGPTDTCSCDTLCITKCRVSCGAGTACNCFRL